MTISAGASTSPKSRAGRIEPAILDSVRYFAWLASSAGEFLLYYWPISLAVLVLGVAAATVGAPFRDPRFRRLFPFLAACYAVPVLLLLAGTSLRYELHGPPHPNWREPPAWYGGLRVQTTVFGGAYL